MLVDAPAGFGKTTLVAQWLHSDVEARPFGWLSLDHGDDDPARLWWYAVSALGRGCPRIGLDDIAAELRTPAPDVIGKTLPALANQLAAFPEPVVLVLDDYHVIKERAIHEQVAFLLLHLPPNAQVVLITRADPPLPLARMRAEGEMVELRARDLRFTQPEAAQLLRAVGAVQLDEPDLEDGGAMAERARPLGVGGSQPAEPDRRAFRPCRRALGAGGSKPLSDARQGGDRSALAVWRTDLISLCHRECRSTLSA